MPTVSAHRPATIVAIEITAARWAFLNADERGDYETADAAYDTMNRLVEEYGRISQHHAYVPLQR